MAASLGLIVVLLIGGDDWQAKARRALAITILERAEAGIAKEPSPKPQPDAYAVARDRSEREGTVLIVFVRCDGPKLPWASVRHDGFPGVTKGIVVSRGAEWMETLPPWATVNDIRFILEGRHRMSLPRTSNVC